MSEEASLLERTGPVCRDRRTLARMRATDRKRTLEMLRQIEERRRRAETMTPDERGANEAARSQAARRMYRWIFYGNTVTAVLLGLALVLLHVRWQTATCVAGAYFLIVTVVLLLSRKRSADIRAYFLGDQGAFAPSRKGDSK